MSLTGVDVGRAEPRLVRERAHDGRLAGTAVPEHHDTADTGVDGGDQERDDR